MTGRPAGYDYPTFAADYRNVAAVLPHLPLAGPAFGNLVWTPNLNAFLAGQPGLGLATLHRYPLQRCFIRPDSPRYATVPNLLAAGASSGLANRFAGFAAIAHAHHLPLRIDEFNTVSCGAVKAVSRHLRLGSVGDRRAVRAGPRRHRRRQRPHLPGRGL